MLSSWLSCAFLRESFPCSGNLLTGPLGIKSAHTVLFQCVWLLCGMSLLDGDLAE